MNSELLKRIEESSAHTQNRFENATYILQNPGLLPELISCSFNIENKLHIKACYILDKVFELQLDLALPFKHFIQNITSFDVQFILDKVFELQLDLALPFLNFICDNLSKLKNDSAIRCISRLIHFVALDNTKKKYLSEINIEKITTVCFDWLISDIRVAPKAHAIYTLFELGKNLNWIYPELKHVLEHYTGSESAGYKSVARKILKKLN